MKIAILNKVIRAISSYKSFGKMACKVPEYLTIGSRELVKAGSGTYFEQRLKKKWKVLAKHTSGQRAFRGSS